MPRRNNFVADLESLGRQRAVDLPVPKYDRRNEMLAAI
jgi:hypothetical protein